MVWPTKEELKKIEVEELKKAEGETQELQNTKYNFVFKEASLSNKEVITIYGEKGCGKTTFALGFPGTIAALSFDRKTAVIKNNMFNGDSRIKVYDVVEFFERDTDKVLDSAEKTYQYIKFILDNIAKTPPDWILVDGVEILQKIAEFVMRRRENLRPYQGVANQNIWKIRNSIIDEIHHRCVNIAKRGVIYTTYTDKDEIIEEGTILFKKTVPKYIDSVMWETDIVLNIISEFDTKNNKLKVKLKCDTSKIDKRIKTGTLIDITDKKASEVINFAG